MHHPFQLVMDSIASFNSIFLDALATTARERPQQFPLPPALLPDFCRLSASDCLERGALSVSLAEARFGEAALWTHASTDASKPQDNDANEFWIARDDRLVLTHSLFLVAWHSAHALPALAQTLFGMTHEVHRLFQSTPFAGLFPLARGRLTWVYPRWRGRVDVWRFIINAQGQDDERMPSPTLRVLQACATDSLDLAVTHFLDSIRVGAVAAASPNGNASQKRRAGSAVSRRTR